RNGGATATQLEQLLLTTRVIALEWSFVVQKSASSRGEQRRSDILRVALRLFNERGTAEVSTNHIAAELGISVGNLYWHFKDKKEIVIALVEGVRGHSDA